MQQEMALIGAVKGGKTLVDWDLVKLCDTEYAAFRLCRRQSPVHFNDGDLAELLGMSRAKLNTILNSDMNERHIKLSRAEQVKLQQICKNTAVDQWAEMLDKGLLNCQRSDREIQIEKIKQEYQQKLMELGA